MGNKQYDTDVPFFWKVLNGNFFLIYRTGSDVITHSYEIAHIQHIHTHSTFTQGCNNMHAQKKYECVWCVHIQHILIHSHKVVIICIRRKVWMCMMCSHSAFSYTFTQGRDKHMRRKIWICMMCSHSNALIAW